MDSASDPGSAWRLALREPFGAVLALRASPARLVLPDFAAGFFVAFAVVFFVAFAPGFFVAFVRGFAAARVVLVVLFFVAMMILVGVSPSANSRPFPRAADG
jgi:hypothetical protein